MLNFVQSQIDKKINLLKDFDYLLKEYNEENEIIKGYNGRQLLELLQNCDDEGSTEVLIKLDKENNTISISNNGTPFSEKGYKSLFMPFRSSKVSKKDYIGNKGLGFRSIIYWSESIEIQSNNISLLYNQNARKDFFHTYYSAEKRQQLLEDEGFLQTAVPVPFLGIPQLKAVNNQIYVTSIIIKYQPSFLKTILQQVKSITPETLFFLKHLQEIKFEGFDDTVQNIKVFKEILPLEAGVFSPIEKITHNTSTWFIFNEEESLGSLIKSDKKEEEFYQIKIAIEKNMTKPTGKLYSFFPTNIHLGQPYILHATFDLDATRNQLVQSDKNKIILQKVVHFTIKVAKYFAKQKVSYKPIQILHHPHKADTLTQLGYYEMIEKAFSTESIFPCVDGNYRRMNQVVYYSNSFAEMLQTVKATEIFSMHLLPTDDIKLFNYSFFSRLFNSFNNVSNIVELLNKIAALPISITERALFINEVVKKGTDFKISNKNQLNLLIDKDNAPILGSEYVYTPETKNSNLKIPSFTNIKFIHRELYLSLSELLNYNKEKDKNRSRFIADKLEGLCNINSFEPAQLARRIIREAKNEIKRKPNDQVLIVQEMNACLFHNFEFINTDSITVPLPIDIPTIALNGDIVVSSETILSKDYPKGHLNQIIFDGIYTEADYVATPEKLGIQLIDEETIYKVQDYLLWLKVNEHANYNVREYNNNGALDYFKSIHKEIYTSYKISATVISNFQAILDKISLENLILWIHNDTILKKQLNNDLNTDKVEYLYRTNYFYRVKQSFIKYQIEKLFKIKFDNLLIDEKYNWVNDIEINYRHPKFVENNLSKSVIQEILVALGAKDNFNDLPIDKVAEIINKLCIKYPDGSRSVTFYKKALSHFKENKVVIQKPIQLFADDGESLKIFNQQEIYFSEKIKLPNKLKKDYPIFNFPARSGGIEAIKFFGINDLNTIKIELNSYQNLDELTVLFNAHLKALKPYILTQRIHDFDDIKSQQIQASICNKISLVLCSELDYKVDEKLYSMSNYEYIHYDDYIYYMKVTPFDDLENLIHHSEFTDNVAEILALSFDVKNDKSEFRNIIRSTIEIVKNDIVRDFGEDTLKEAKELLGLADYKQAFWKTIFSIKAVGYEGALDDLALNDFITEKLNINFDVARLDYESISNTTQKNTLSNLFTELSISLTDFAKDYPFTISYELYHFKTLRDLILSKKVIVKSAIWKKNNDKNLDVKKGFLTQIDRFEYYENFVKEVSQQNKHSFTIDKNKYFDIYITNVYGELKLDDTIDFEKILNSNSTHFTFEELNLINQNIELKSLLHFENAIEDLKSILKTQSNVVVEAKSENTLSETVKPNEIEVLSSNNLKTKKKLSIPNEKRKPYLPGKENSGKLKAIGNASEDIVVKYLKDNKFTNIYKVTDDNEGLHYDIRFTDENGNIKFIEVKTFNTGMFYLSKDEYDFGKQHQEDYEIWLVKNGKTIIPINDFFTNPKYQPITNEYVVYLDIE